MGLFKNNNTTLGALFAIPGPAPEKVEKLTAWVKIALPSGHGKPAPWERNREPRCKCGKRMNKCEALRQQELVSEHAVVAQWGSTLRHVTDSVAQLSNEERYRVQLEQLLAATPGVMQLAQTYKGLAEAQDALLKNLERRYRYNELVAAEITHLPRVNGGFGPDAWGEGESESDYAARLARLVEHTSLGADLLRDKATWEAKQLELDAAKADLDALYAKANEISWKMSQEIIARRERLNDEEACRGIAQASISGTTTLETTYVKMSPAALRAMAQLTNM